MHSTSTAMLPGSEPMPTALRAPTPASSPKTSAISSEKPLITCGWSLKSGVQLTMPSVLTNRLTLSSEPSVSRTVARMLRPTRRAASLPCSSVRSAPTRPATSFPSLKGPWPETWSMLPASTAVLYLATGFGAGGSIRCSSWTRVSGFDGISVSFASSGSSGPEATLLLSAARAAGSSRAPKNRNPRGRPGRGGGVRGRLWVAEVVRLRPGGTLTSSATAKTDRLLALAPLDLLQDVLGVALHLVLLPGGRVLLRPGLGLEAVLLTQVVVQLG